MGGYFLCGPRISTSLLARQKTPGCSAAPDIHGAADFTRWKLDGSWSSLQRISISPILQVITSSAAQCWSTAGFRGLYRDKPAGRHAGALEQQRQAVKIGVRAGPPHPLLRLLGCIVMQHAQGALIGVTLRIVRGGKNDSGKPSFKAKQERIFIPSCQHCDSNPSIVCWNAGNSRSLGQRPAIRGRVI